MNLGIASQRKASNSRVSTTAALIREFGGKTYVLPVGDIVVSVLYVPAPHYWGSPVDPLRIPLVYALAPGDPQGNPQGTPLVYALTPGGSPEGLKLPNMANRPLDELGKLYLNYLGR